MNQEMFARLLRYSGFAAEETAVLREFHPLVQHRFPEVVDDFYRRILADDATRRVLQSPEQVLHLRVSLHRWLDEVFLDARDDDYRVKRLVIGEVHVKVGLPPAYVFTAMSHIQNRITEAILALDGVPRARLGRVLDALTKALHLELALISGAYHEADKYRDIVELAPEMIHCIDRSGCFVLVNQSEVNRLGYPAEAIIGAKLEDFVHEDDRPAIRQHLDRVFSRGESHCEVRMLTATGETVHVEILATGQRDILTHEITGTRAYVRDISERRLAEEELQKERELERRILEIAGVIVLILGRDGRIRLINRKGCQILGWGEGELTGTDWFETALPASQREAVRAVFHRVIAGGGGSILPYENVVIARDGSERVIEWHNTTLLDARGEVEGTLSSGLDVTERKRMARELLEKQSLARLGEMAAVVAHEVRNPLAGISGALQIIGENLGPAHPDGPVIGEILDRIDALNATVNDLLLYARPRLPRPVPTPVRTLVEDVAKLARQDAAFADITVEIEGGDEMATLDAELVKPVILNLFVNAAQAMRRGKVRVVIAREARWVRMDVIDQGPGIPADIRERVFEPFFSTKHSGTGLGLSIARRIVDAHGGSITLACPPAGGTTITVRLPAPA